MKRTDLKKSLKAIKRQIGSPSLQDIHFNRIEICKTPNYFCECADASGNPKTLYKTKNEALNTIWDRSLKLTAYPCPFEKGWHLSKG